MSWDFQNFDLNFVAVFEIKIEMVLHVKMIHMKYQALF